MRYASAFDKDVLYPLPSSITYSTGFLARLYKITHGFRLEITSMCPTSTMPTTIKYSAVATSRCKAYFKLFITTPQQ